MEHARNRIAAALNGILEIFDGLHDLGITHISHRVIILMDGEDPGVPLVCLVEFKKIGWVFRDNGEVVGGGECEMDVVILAIQPRFRRSDDAMSGLAEKDVPANQSWRSRQDTA